MLPFLSPVKLYLLRMSFMIFHFAWNSGACDTYFFCYTLLTVLWQRK